MLMVKTVGFICFLLFCHLGCLVRLLFGRCYSTTGLATASPFLVIRYSPVYNNAVLVQLCSFYEFEINLIVRVNKHSSRLRTAAYPVVIPNPF